MNIAILSASLMLAACATIPEIPRTPQPEVTCRGDSLASFIGQPYDAALGARMMKATSSSKLRAVAKGMMVTMDFQSDRLTVYLDARNRVERANCG